jgi:phage terminase large subunit-like protein
VRVRTAPWFLGRGGGETAVLGLLCGPARGRWPRVGFGFCRTRSTRLNFLFTPAAVSAACGDEPLDLAGLSVFAGLNLSESADLTALVLAHPNPDTGVWHVRPIFWLPEEGLAEKAARDRVPYDLWASQGYLETTPGAAVDYEHVAERLKDVFDDTM